MAAVVLSCGQFAQQERGFQQVEQFDVGEVARYAFEPAVDDGRGRGGRQRPAGFVGHQHVHAIEQCAHPACGFAVERDQGQVAFAVLQLRRHPGGDGARFGLQMGRRAERELRHDGGRGVARGQRGGAFAQRWLGALPGLVQRRSDGVGRGGIGGRFKQGDRRVLGMARQKLLFHRGERAQCVAIQGLRRAARVRKQRVEPARITRLRVGAVGVERLPYGFDQRGFLVECVGMQRAYLRADVAALPRGRQRVGQLQQLVGKRPLVDFAKPVHASEHAMELCQASRRRLAGRVGDALRPAFERDDGGRDQCRAACRLR